jgi:hypothetical protein
VLDSRPVTLLLAAVVGALFVGGLAVDGALGALMLAAVLAGMIVLSATTWDRIPARGRAARVIVARAVAGLVVLKLTD